MQLPGSYSRQTRFRARNSAQQANVLSLRITIPSRRPSSFILITPGTSFDALSILNTISTWLESDSDIQTRPFFTNRTSQLDSRYIERSHAIVWQRSLTRGFRILRRQAAFERTSVADASHVGTAFRPAWQAQEQGRSLVALPVAHAQDPPHRSSGHRAARIDPRPGARPHARRGKGRFESLYRLRPSNHLGQPLLAPRRWLLVHRAFERHKLQLDSLNDTARQLSGR